MQLAGAGGKAVFLQLFNGSMSLKTVTRSLELELSPKSFDFESFENMTKNRKEEVLISNPLITGKFWKTGKLPTKKGA